ncbi:MAG: hypothetical protein V2B14_00115 [bacterium]
MVENIISTNNSDFLINSSIKQQELTGIEKKTASKNPYLSQAEFADKSDISKEALNLYEQDKDIEKFKKMVLDSLDDDSDISDIKEIVNLLIDKKYVISNDDLAQSMLNDGDLVDLLFSE